MIRNFTNETERFWNSQRSRKLPPHIQRTARLVQRGSPNEPTVRAYAKVQLQP